MTYLSQLGRARQQRLHAWMAMNDDLRFLSAYIPGGVFNLIALVRMSTDENVRQVAVLWNSLPRKEHRTVNLNQLCLDAGVAPSRVFGSMIETAYELGMDVSLLLRAAVSLPSAMATIPSVMKADIARAKSGSWRDRERLFRLSGFLPDPNAPVARTDASDPDSDLETIEEDTKYCSRMLRASLRRELRQKGRG